MKGEEGGRKGSFEEKEESIATQYHLPQLQSSSISCSRKESGEKGEEKKKGKEERLRVIISALISFAWKKREKEGGRSRK